MTAHHPAALPKGHRIGEYEIVRVLGAGGFGVTYLAFDHQLDGPVALKEYFPAEAARRGTGWGVAPSTTGSQALFTWGLDRFIDEARSLHRLRHANVVRAHRYVQAHGTAYIVMEYVEGKSLQQVIREGGRLTPDAWRRWLDPLLDGLAHVHGHGYLHRDLKPAHIMTRAADGTPVLIDFGAARLAARDRTHTQVLTPGYAPLEQYSREGTQGPPTDIYALAAVSYHVLTGVRLSSAPDRVLDDDYEPLANRIQGADRRWLAAIDHALALRPEDRPQTVAAWTAAMPGASTAPVPDVDAEARPSRNVGRTTVPQQDDSAAPRRASRALMYFLSAVAVFFWGAVLVRELPEFLPGEEVYFALGSHQDDVLGIQGTPASIDEYPSLGHDIWRYGSSTVTISPRTSRVIGWSNRDGNLKVRLVRGRNGTNATSYTRGSHEDDVLHLQGMPTRIESVSTGIEDARGNPFLALVRPDERWHYGYSTVTISGGTRRVTGWLNVEGNLRVVPPTTGE